MPVNPPDSGDSVHLATGADGTPAAYPLTKIPPVSGDPLALSFDGTLQPFATKVCPPADGDPVLILWNVNLEPVAVVVCDDEVGCPSWTDGDDAFFAFGCLYSIDAAGEWLLMEYGVVCDELTGLTVNVSFRAETLEEAAGGSYFTPTLYLTTFFDKLDTAEPGKGPGYLYGAHAWDGADYTFPNEHILTDGEADFDVFDEVLDVGFSRDCCAAYAYCILVIREFIAGSEQTVLNVDPPIQWAAFEEYLLATYNSKYLLGFVSLRHHSCEAPLVSAVGAPADGVVMGIKDSLILYPDGTSYGYYKYATSEYSVDEQLGFEKVYNGYRCTVTTAGVLGEAVFEITAIHDWKAVDTGLPRSEVIPSGVWAVCPGLYPFELEVSPANPTAVLPVGYTFFVVFSSNQFAMSAPTPSGNAAPFPDPYEFALPSPYYNCMLKTLRIEFTEFYSADVARALAGSTEPMGYIISRRSNGYAGSCSVYVAAYGDLANYDAGVHVFTIPAFNQYLVVRNAVFPFRVNFTSAPNFGTLYWRWDWSSTSNSVYFQLDVESGAFVNEHPLVTARMLTASNNFLPELLSGFDPLEDTCVEGQHWTEEEAGEYVWYACPGDEEVPVRVGARDFIKRIIEPPAGAVLVQENNEGVQYETAWNSPCGPAGVGLGDTIVGDPTFGGDVLDEAVQPLFDQYLATYPLDGSNDNALLSRPCAEDLLCEYNGVVSFHFEVETHDTLTEIVLSQHEDLLANYNTCAPEHVCCDCEYNYGDWDTYLCGGPEYMCDAGSTAVSGEMCHAFTVPTNGDLHNLSYADGAWDTRIFAAASVTSQPLMKAAGLPYARMYLSETGVYWLGYFGAAAYSVSINTLFNFMNAWLDPTFEAWPGWYIHDNADDMSFNHFRFSIDENYRAVYTGEFIDGAFSFEGLDSPTAAWQWTADGPGSYKLFGGAGAVPPGVGLSTAYSVAGVAASIGTLCSPSFRLRRLSGYKTELAFKLGNGVIEDEIPEVGGPATHYYTVTMTQKYSSSAAQFSLTPSPALAIIDPGMTLHGISGWPPTIQRNTLFEFTAYVDQISSGNVGDSCDIVLYRSNAPDVRTDDAYPNAYYTGTSVTAWGSVEGNYGYTYHEDASTIIKYPFADPRTVFCGAPKTPSPLEMFEDAISDILPPAVDLEILDFPGMERILTLCKLPSIAKPTPTARSNIFMTWAEELAFECSLALSDSRFMETDDSFRIDVFAGAGRVPCALYRMPAEDRTLFGFPGDLEDDVNSAKNYTGACATMEVVADPINWYFWVLKLSGSFCAVPTMPDAYATAAYPVNLYEAFVDPRGDDKTVVVLMDFYEFDTYTLSGRDTNVAPGAFGGPFDRRSNPCLINNSVAAGPPPGIALPATGIPYARRLSLYRVVYEFTPVAAGTGDWSSGAGFHYPFVHTPGAGDHTRAAVLNGDGAPVWEEVVGDTAYQADYGRIPYEELTRDMCGIVITLSAEEGCA